MDLDHTHDPEARSWLESANAADTPFPLQNLPLGRIRRDGELHVASAIGDRILDLTVIKPELRSLLPLGDPTARRQLRHWLFAELQNGDSPLKEQSQAWLEQAEPALPFEIGDYTDFYASIHHATRVGSMFRPDNPLLPNYRWVPIGYHGRASSVVVSGTEVRRPSGQLKAEDSEKPSFGPCKMLDYELELGIWIGSSNALGEPVPVSEAHRHWIGIGLVNDWSARDIQKWEYQPLGPFLAKSFATTVSPWVITQEALAPFRVPPEREGPAPLPYLAYAEDWALDLQLEVQLNGQQISTSNPRDLYWTIAQMIAHHTSNGCNLRAGDLLATGTISGPTPESAGCLLELTWRGTGQPRQPVAVPGGTRTFLQEGDEVTLSGWARKSGYRSIGLGSCSGRVR